MHIENITNVQAGAFLIGFIVVIYLIYRLIPAQSQEVEWKTYTQGEIRSYDRQIPKYFLLAAVALILGGLQTVIKNLPGFYQWLWVAGYGGHLFRDLSNSHIIIVGGGTILLTGLTWYALPRFTNRPLFSPTLASMSFWFTVIGLYGFYISWIVLGLIEGNMIAHGWDYLAAKAALGNWHTVPTAMTASIMGLGYWTYVLNTFLTVVASRNVQSKPLGYLVKFSVVCAVGLFIGTVQGVIQVLPNNADWIRLAGHFGEYIDPISHAHINLVTGVMMSLVGFLIFFAPLLGGNAIGKKNGNLIFWVLAPGSIVFYLSFLFLGLVLGGAVNGYGGIQDPILAAFMGQARIPLLAFAGIWMLAGFWLYFITLWRSLGWKNFKQEFRNGTPKAFWLVSSLALIVGTFQGLLQVIPATAQIITLPSEMTNIHAQLNMIGGVLLALIGLAYAMLPKLINVSVDPKMRQYSLYGISFGIFSYYIVTMISGLIRYGYLHRGLSDAQTAAHLNWVIPTLLVLTSIPMFLGYLAFGTGLYQATPEYRAEWADSLAHIADRYNGPARPWLMRFPMRYYLIAEAVSSIAGFPGLGWILSGKAFPGVLFMIVGPVLAWAAIPSLFDPFMTGLLVPIGYESVLVYLGITTLLSVFSLWMSIRRRMRVLSTIT
ncbi:MAG: hypothetical protein ACM3PY_17805 [Omnitrophica WOR_2 bacterium]